MNDDYIPEEPSPRKEKEPTFDWGKFQPVPAYLKSEYWEVRLTSQLSDKDTHALIALRHGLEPSGSWPWTLKQLAKLEFLRWRDSREKL